MADSMIERLVAAATQQMMEQEAKGWRKPGSPRRDIAAMVRAIVTAMREPTEAMRHEGKLALDMTHPDQELWGNQWGAMINAALAED